MWQLFHKHPSHQTALCRTTKLGMPEYICSQYVNIVISYQKWERQVQQCSMSALCLKVASKHAELAIQSVEAHTCRRLAP